MQLSCVQLPIFAFLPCVSNYSVRTDCVYNRMTMLCEIVMAMVMVGEVLGQATMETEDMEIVSTGTVEGFMKTKEFKAIVGGCACFWGSVFSMGLTYMIIVFCKRSFEPQEVVKEEE